jgi:hypothetical protein
MSVLVIDDERVVPFTALYARTVEAATHELLKSWEQVYFDHDLGDKFGRDTINVLRHLEREGLRPRIGTAYVHSMNPVGAKNIMDTLIAWKIPAYRIPLPTGHSVVQ